MSFTSRYSVLQKYIVSLNNRLGLFLLRRKNMKSSNIHYQSAIANNDETVTQLPLSGVLNDIGQNMLNFVNQVSTGVWIQDLHVGSGAKSTAKLDAKHAFYVKNVGLALKDAMYAMYVKPGARLHLNAVTNDD